MAAQLDRRRQAQAFVSTVPTSLMHSGNFSQISKLIYDPTDAIWKYSASLFPETLFRRRASTAPAKR